MNKHIIHSALKNFSKYPREIVWENAQDLEHVKFLHRNTNKDFEILHSEKAKDSPYQYDTMIYRGVRRFLYYFPIQAVGFRKIISDYNIWQLEYIPAIRTKVALNSLLIKTGSQEYPTMLLDEVVLEIPALLSFMENGIIQSLRRHTRIQCSEDEPFRARRKVLQDRNIRLPYSVLNESAWKHLTGLFQETVQSAPPAPHEIAAVR